LPPQEQRNAEIYNTRKSQIGSGARSEKVRTYNYKARGRPPRPGGGKPSRGGGGGEGRAAGWHGGWPGLACAMGGVGAEPAGGRAARAAGRLQDNRVSDHRINVNFPLNTFIEGNVDDAISTLQSEEQKELLRQMAEEALMAA